jgi:hypothetical protein
MSDDFVAAAYGAGVNAKPRKERRPHDFLRASAGPRAPGAPEWPRPAPPVHWLHVWAIHPANQAGRAGRALRHPGRRHQRTSFPVLTSQSCHTPSWSAVTSFVSPSKNDRKQTSLRHKRPVPRRATAPAGRGSPYWSTLVPLGSPLGSWPRTVGTVQVRQRKGSHSVGVAQSSLDCVGGGQLAAGRRVHRQANRAHQGEPCASASA